MALTKVRVDSVIIGIVIFCNSAEQVDILYS